MFFPHILSIEPLDPQTPVGVRIGRSILRHRRLIAAAAFVAVAAVAVFLYVEAHRYASSSSSVSLVIPGEQHRWKLEVVNGTAENGLAQGVTDMLRKLGYDVVELRTQRTPPLPRCLVIDRSGNREGAEEVAAALGLPHDRVQTQVDKSLYLDFTIAVGADFRSFNMLSGALQ